MKNEIQFDMEAVIQALRQGMSLCRIILSFLSVTSQLPINRGATNIDDSGGF